MKTKIFSIIAVAAIIGGLAFNSITNYNKATVSAVTLSNLEALTRDETNTWCLQVGIGCSDGIFYPNSSHLPGGPY